MTLVSFFGRRRPDNQLIRLARRGRAWLTALLNGFPARRLIVIGVTGTDGKTSTCHYLTQILEEAGHQVGMITTVATQIAGERRLNTSKMTTLDPGELHHSLRMMVRHGCRYAVIETTSHALDQDRVWAIPYHCVVLTNVTHDHLDYHGTMEAYQKAKEKLFAANPAVAVINADSAAAPTFLKYPADRHLTYGILDRQRPKGALSHPDLTASLVKLTESGATFRLTTPVGASETSIPIPGRFMLANALAAAAAAVGLGLRLETIVATLARLKPVEGRLEPVDCGQSFAVVVDFAHTPDALQQVYETIRPTVTGKLIAVLGATGDRDKTKRPILGALAGRYADLVIVTNEDPYTEDPQAIINEVASGVPRGRPGPAGGMAGTNKGEGEWWWRVLDRREAIAKALGLAKRGDTVLITGKGGEHVMAVGNKLIPYNDVQVVKDILSRND